MSERTLSEAARRLSAARLVLWDFDGVIKESVEVKAQAFTELFRPFGDDVARRAADHHRANSGISRYEKLPLYLAWAGQASDAPAVQRYEREFAGLVVRGVIEAAWVPGALEYLSRNPHGQRFGIVTATPEGEMTGILAALRIDALFCRVSGAPRPKTRAVAEALAAEAVRPSDAVLVGDAVTDMDAAERNGVPFVLRRTKRAPDACLERHPALDDFLELL
jgi:phosphoglycolate phosphatase-like HAD superfamily hydrolase